MQISSCWSKASRSQRTNYGKARERVDDEKNATMPQSSKETALFGLSFFSYIWSFPSVIAFGDSSPRTQGYVCASTRDKLAYLEDD